MKPYKSRWIKPFGIFFLQIESTKRVILKQVYKSNPWTKSLKVGLTNLDLQVCKSWFVRICDTHGPGFIRIQPIYSTKDLWGFVRICQIFWKLAGLVNHSSKQIFLSPDLWSTIRTESEFVVHEPKQIFKSQYSSSTIQNESTDLRDKSSGTWFPYSIPATLLKAHAHREGIDLKKKKSNQNVQFLVLFFFSPMPLDVYTDTMGTVSIVTYVLLSLATAKQIWAMKVPEYA